MQSISRFFYLTGSVALAAVPAQFTAGSAAKAEDVNKNFAYLDSTKADRSTVALVSSAVNAKLDIAEATTKLGAKVDTSTFGKYVREQAGKAVSATIANDTSGVKDWTSKYFTGTVPVAAIKGQGPSDYGAAAFMRRDLAGGGSVLDVHTDGVFNSWSVNGGIQTNSVTRIDGNGNGLLSTLAVGTTNTYGATASFQYNGTGGDWNEGIVLVPSPTYNATNIFFRANQTNSDSAICFGRRAGGLGVTMKQLSFSPFTISASGNTTIGGTLTANGKVLASAAEITDLRVAGTLRTSPTEPWADYVFEPGYKAMALKDVETFAKANGHLPEVPSAAEVQKDGIDLAKMNAILLKKIEELTLHAVAQEKRMEAQQAQLETQQSQMNALRSKMETLESK